MYCDELKNSIDKTKQKFQNFLISQLNNNK